VALEEAELEVEKSQHLRVNRIENVRWRIRIFGHRRHGNHADNGVVSDRLAGEFDIRVDVASAGDEYKRVLAESGELEQLHQIVAGGVGGNPDGKVSPVRPFDNKWKRVLHELRAEKFPKSDNGAAPRAYRGDCSVISQRKQRIFVCRNMKTSSSI
jgi:hypothetical protein